MYAPREARGMRVFLFYREILRRVLILFYRDVLNQFVVFIVAAVRIAYIH